MAFIYPAHPEFKNDSEEQVYDYIKRNLPESYISYFNYHIQNREFDFMILVPDVGIFILEIKGWLSNQIYRVQDNTCILTKNSSGIVTPWPSPLKQVNDYRFEVIRKIEKEIKKDLLVIPVVCYPYISKEQFHDKRLDIISPEEVTLFKDDFSTDFSLENRLNEIAKSFENIAQDNFSLDNMFKVRCFFETEEQIQTTMKNLNITGTVKAAEKHKRELYSILTYLPANLDEQKVKKFISEAVEHWAKGTKIFFISNSQEIINDAESKLNEKLEQLNIIERFKKGVFNFFTYKVEHDYKVPLQIIDGDLKNINQYKEKLKVFNKESNFNLNQYEVEHAPSDQHILIKAGAGSGKTFSMISRINFLIYSHKLNFETIKEAIFLITFSNEAANNMKQKLQQYFHNYYLITRDYEVFRLIESIENMKISTIHSLAKKILQKYSVKLGLGNDIRIVTGKYERDQILAETLNGYLTEKSKEEPELISNLRLSMYHLLDRLKAILHKLENKNLDVLNDLLSFGQSNLPEMNKLIKEVLIRTEKKTRELLEDRNTIRLNDLMIRLKQIVKEEPEDLSKYRIKYLFVDEFQDTDDVQIELMRSFQQVINFSFFVVGDIKQCIYRFRGAEDRAFDKLTENQQIKFLSYSLNKNYRTDHLLLEKFERRFRKWGEGENPNLIYNPIDDQLISHKKINDLTSEYFKPINLNDEDDQEEFELKFMEELENQYNRLSNNGTIAILVRDNREVDFIRKLGVKHGYYIETDNGGDLFQLDPTLDFYKLVLALQNSKSPKHLYNLFNSNYIFKSLNKNDLFLRRNNTKELLDYFYSNPPIQNWSQHLLNLKKEPVLYVLRQMILEIRPWEIYAKNSKLEGENQVKIKSYYKRNLDQLFEKLTNISEQDYLTINKIEHYLRIMIMTKQREESRDNFDYDLGETKNIVCMTVHKSKGLEFETVILPFVHKELDDMKKVGPLDIIITKQKEVGFQLRLDEKLNGTKYLKNDIYKSQKKSEHALKKNEETRILYVALTRAIETFVYFQYTNSKANESWQSLLKEGELSIENLHI